MKIARKGAALSLGVAAVALGVAGAVTENTFAEGNQVTIPDQAFFNCLTNGGVMSNPGNNVVEVPVVDATNHIIDVSNFSEYMYVNVRCSNRGITSIEGFQNLPFFDYPADGWDGVKHGSVIMADFQNNNISDVSPITAHGKMTYVYLDNNNISDISSFSNLNSLYYLHLANNNITSIESLRNITDLKSLDISNNQISDINVLNNQTGITLLYTSFNNLGNDAKNVLASMTGLINLGISQTGISDLSFVSSLPNLKQLYAHTNGIKDYSPLASKTDLERLSLSWNDSADISPLAGLTKLEGLSISGLGLTNNSCQYLNNLTSLETLDISMNELTNVQGLSPLTNLSTLNIALNHIEDFSGIPSSLTYEGTDPKRVYGQTITIDAGAATSVKLPEMVAQYMSSELVAVAMKVETWGGSYDQESNTVTLNDDADVVTVRVSPRLETSIIPQYDPAHPYYLELTITRTKETTDNPDTKNGISTTAGIFGGLIAAMGALFTIKRSRR